MRDPSWMASRSAHAASSSSPSASRLESSSGLSASPSGRPAASGGTGGRSGVDIGATLPSAARGERYHVAMYLDAMEFLEEERDAWAPYEALAALTDEQLSRPVEAAHGWSGRDLMGHLLAWQGVALEAAQELAVNETSDRFARMTAEWDERGADRVNDDLQAAWAS